MRGIAEIGPAPFHFVLQGDAVEGATPLSLPSTKRPAAKMRVTFRSKFFRHPGLILAGSFIALLLVAALFPSLIAPGNPLETSARHAFEAPSLAHPFGMDENGRDLYTRIVHGARSSVVMGLGATVIGMCFGVAIGIVSGLGPRWIDGLFMRVVDVLLAFPDILLALLIITFWGQGSFNAVVAVGFASVPRYARLVRSQVHVIKHAGYVEAATTLGLGRLAVIWRHLLPNAIKPVIVLSIIGIGGKIAAGAGLSFLGLGTPPPAPDWGAMIALGRNFLANAWWLTAAPSIVVTLTVLSLGVMGRALMKHSEGKRLT